MNNRDRYGLARFTVSTQVQDAIDGRPEPPPVAGLVVGFCAVLVFLALLFF